MAPAAAIAGATVVQTYLGLLGDLNFVDAMRELVLGTALPAARVAGAQTPGGTGAIHLLLELVRMADPHATVWISEPTWPNHPAILKHLGVPFRTYRYFSEATGEFDGTASSGTLSVLEGLGDGELATARSRLRCNCSRRRRTTRRAAWRSSPGSSGTSGT